MRTHGSANKNVTQIFLKEQKNRVIHYLDEKMNSNPPIFHLLNTINNTETSERKIETESVIKEHYGEELITCLKELGKVYNDRKISRLKPVYPYLNDLAEDCSKNQVTKLDAYRLFNTVIKNIDSLTEIATKKLLTIQDLNDIE